MDEIKKSSFMISALLHINAVLLAAVLYLVYRNFLAEDMIKELNRDYTELFREHKRLLENT